MENKAPVYVGTAGWGIAKSYAAMVPGAGTHLERYGQVLNAAEINTSFYRPHRRQTYEKWAASVPRDFRFAVKLPQVVTHEERLRDAAAALDRFAEEVGGLGPKLGVLLVQLPPSLLFEADIADRFFSDLTARLSVPVACEPRHRTWFGAEAEALLRRHAVARVAADPAPVPAAADPGAAEALVYVRLHGSPKMYYSDYPLECLSALQRRLADFRRRAQAVWCIFDNTAAFAALGNALTTVAALKD